MVALISALVIGVAAGVAAFTLTDSRTDAERLVGDFVAELNDRDAEGAAALTSYPNAASATLTQLFDGLSDGTVDYDITQLVELSDESGYFTLSGNWNFGPDKDWAYQVDGSVKKLAVGWRVSWSPDVVVPDLGGGRTVHHVRTDAAPPRIFDRNGQLLMDEQTINTVVLDPATMPDPVLTTTLLGDVLAPVAPVITALSLQQRLTDQPGERIAAVKLRDQDYQFLEDSIVPIPGVEVIKTPTLISSDRRVSSPLLDSLRGAWQLERDRTAGWAVTLEDPQSGPIQVAGFQGPPPPDLASTLDSHVQLAAKEAVVSVGTPAAIVAIQPSTGGILALDVNNQAMELGPVATRGLYPAGSAADPIRLAAAIALGKDPSQVSTAELGNVARSLGLGLDYTVPGFDFETAQFGQDRDGVVQFTSSPSDNDTLLSPLGAALLAASVARGTSPLPTIVQGQPATVSDPADPLPPRAIDALRGMMVDNVQNGPASFLKGHPGLTGIAAQNDNDRWFYGVSGDLAFAVFVANADGGDRAVKMADMFLRELAKPADAF
ncbi:MAG: NTF2-like N-terminal transpeptidase domain-containing protein [Rhodococcus sp. (in: high G+C Gram-positive bacteria)]|uniref:NTF2-like N-terminal transpeptidase domain-containing protein n=1 Tax=Rhodococcus sp. TaxID=1831 RepID=UPI003BB6A81C